MPHKARKIPVMLCVSTISMRNYMHGSTSSVTAEFKSQMGDQGGREGGGDMFIKSV